MQCKERSYIDRLKGRRILREREVYPKIAFKSSSGVVIGCKLNFSTKIPSTVLDKNFGKDGPM